MVNGTVTKTQKKAHSGLTNLQIMKDKSKAPQVRIASFQELLTANMTKISECLPEGCGITAQRMMRLVLGSFRLNPTLLDCSIESIFLAVNEAATLGLQLDGTLGHAYLVPYKDECKLMPGYKGLIDLARRKDKIVLKTRCVYRGDVFEYQEGDDDFIRHVPDQSGECEFNDNMISHVYLVAKDMITREVICRNVWSKRRIEKHKEKYSKAWDNAKNPWKTAWSTMARKTLIRDSIARGELAVSVEIQRLANREEQHEAKFFEAPAPARRTTIDDIGNLLESHGGGLQKGSSITVPDDVIESAFEEDEIPFGADYDPSESENPDQEEDVELEEEEVSEPLEEEEETVQDEPDYSGYLIQEGETPRQWFNRITGLIRGAKSSEELDLYLAAIDQEGASSRASKDMIEKLQVSWENSNRRFMK